MAYPSSQVPVQIRSTRPVTVCVQVSVTLLITQATPCPSDTTQTAILPAITQLVTPTAQIAHNCFFVIYSPPLFFRVPYRINPSDGPQR